MSLELSTGLRNATMGAGGASFADALVDGVIGVFNATAQPTSADAAETGTLLALITVAKGAFVAGSPTNGISLGTASDGTVGIASGETWSGTVLAAAGTGTDATYLRYYDNNYTTGASTTAVRLDCGVATDGSQELTLENVTLVEDGTATITSAAFTLPASSQ